MDEGNNNRHNTSIYRIGMVLVFAFLICAALLPSAQASLPNALISMKQVGSRDLSAFTKWTSLMPRYKREMAALEKACEGTNCKNKEKWDALLSELKDKPLKEKLDGVNSFFNAVTYISDTDNYGKDDYWATPYEMMARGGDCEDYAIAKYISLKRLGVPESSMRIMIVVDNNLGGVMHAILQVTDGKTRYLLDNQASSVTAAADVFHYQPVYALNGQQWWAYQ